MDPVKTLLVLSGRKNRASDLNLARMASHLGASVEVLDLPDEGVGPSCAANERAGLWDRVTSSVGLAIHADTLALLYGEEQSRSRVRERLSAAGSVFLHGVAAGSHDEPLNWLSDGLLRGTDTTEGVDECELPSRGSRFTHQMAGSEFPRAKSGTATTVLVVAEQTGGVLPLMTVSGAPTFLCVEHNGAPLFVSTASDFPDPEQRVTSEESIEAFYETLVPLIVFVRAACGPYCWQGGWNAARLIIDDPVLRRIYGYLDFSKLFDSVGRHQYAATVAFIPWNQSRTSEKEASFFRAAGPHFSLCVHGCDHTNNEYGALSEEYLEHKSRLAMQRMRRHETRTRIPFEPVMVFPQGRFSTASLRALRSTGFLAAINSTRFPLDADAPPVSLWQLLQPAISGAHGFPVFSRHYVEPVFPSVFSLFLGRPAFVVEHHEFFRAGLPLMESLADRLNRSAPGLSWGSLSETVERACWKRAVSSSASEVLFFADRFVLTNDSDRRRTYRLLKDEAEPDAVAAVSVNERTTPTSRAGERIAFEVSLGPSETGRVELHRTLSPSRPFVREGAVYAGKVLVRRALSEFRDEFLVKHPVMLASAKRMVRALRASSDSLPRPGSERVTSR
jgi:hypothetical protein